MKTLISYFALAALILTSSFTIDTQQKLNEQPSAKQSPQSCFNYFRVHRQGKAGVALTWSVSAPDVVSFVVERSYDGEFFENASNVNFNGSAAYKFNDEGVFPGVTYYRITAVKSNATTECSTVESIRIQARG